jgi:hypothetical protein
MARYGVVIVCILIVAAFAAESGATRTPIPAQHSGDCGQQVMAA